MFLFLIFELKWMNYAKDVAAAFHVPLKRKTRTTFCFKLRHVS